MHRWQCTATQVIQPQRLLGQAFKLGGLRPLPVVTDLIDRLGGVIQGITLPDAVQHIGISLDQPGRQLLIQHLRLVQVAGDSSSAAIVSS